VLAQRKHGQYTTTLDQPLRRRSNADEHSRHRNIRLTGVPAQQDSRYIYKRLFYAVIGGRHNG